MSHILFAVIFIAAFSVSSSDWFNCGFNENACTSLECSAEDAAIRSQIMCNQFPYYSGGLNLFRYESQWSEVATFTGSCQHASINSTDIDSSPHCDEWTTSPTNAQSEIANCECMSASSTSPICESWQCHHQQMEQNEKEQTDASAVASECHCTDANITAASHLSCHSWTCNNTHSTTKYECISEQLNDTQNVYYAEFARYSSEVDQSHSNSFCWQWSGDTMKKSDADQNSQLTSSEWTVSNCQCDTPHIVQVNDSNGVSRVINAYCETWTCFQKTMAYHEIPALHFYLSWSIAAVVGILFFIAIYILLECSAKRKYCKHARILKVVLIAVLLICLLALLFAAFESGGTLSVFIVMFVWLLCVIGTVVFQAVRRFVEKKRSSALQKAQQQFAKQREQYLQQKFTTKNLFRLSMVESEQEFDMDI